MPSQPSLCGLVLEDIAPCCELRLGGIVFFLHFWKMCLSTKHLCCAMVVMSSFLTPKFAQDTGVCPPGWEGVAREFLGSRLESNWEEAALCVVPGEQQSWLDWQKWSENKLEVTLAALPQDIQARHHKEVERERARLEVSNCTCDPVANGDFRIRIDPDGRSYQFLTMRLETSVWHVVTRMVELDLESTEMVKAYMQASDARRWEEAEAWVAQSSRSRFAGYRAEVEMFLSSSEWLTNGRKEQAELRVAEWGEGQMRAEQLTEDMLEVHMEFPSAEPMSCELLRVDESWRILLR